MLIAQSTAQGHPRAVHKFKHHKLNTIQNLHIIYKSKTHKRNPKFSPFGIALVKKWQMKLGNAGTIDRFGLAFQYQIKKYIKQDGQKQLQIKNTM